MEQKMKLYQILNSEYIKDDLKYFADLLQLRGTSALRKEELAKRVAEEMLKPKVMREKLAWLSDQELKLFMRVVNAEDLTYKTEKKTDVTAITLQLTSRYCFFDEDDRLIVPEDVAAVWRLIDQEELRKRHEVVWWIEACLFYVDMLYLKAPLDIFMKLLERKKGFHISREELEGICLRMPAEIMSCIIDDDYVFSLKLLSHPDEYESILEMQGGKDYYIPTHAEILELAENYCLISGKPYRDLEQFLIRKIHMDAEEANLLLAELWEKIALGDDFMETLHWFVEEIILEGEDQLRELLDLLMEVSNHTNMTCNRGFTPKILREATPMKGLPTIVPGSSHAAEMLKEAEAEIQKMGFKLDLDSNADEIPVMKFPSGVNGPAKVETKKIYPNDPCPCGSGKKYKKCCGRNK